ncbi:MAG: cupin domain-containing protein [Rhodothermales bacterium]
MPQPMTHLGDLSVADFMTTYWQKQPVLLRGVFPDFQSPITPQDLLDLACEPDATSRLIMEEGGEYPWQLHYGPFEPAELADLPASKWTVLVQEVDRLVPAMGDLLQRFRFVPNWRLDDLMVSYAPEGGSVGAHIDNYDVFLIQGWGHRRWGIGHTPIDEEVLVPDMDVRMLAGFEGDVEWVLAPGDVLYLPPRIAHYGVALDDCMTFSVGFRAPSPRDLLMKLLEDLLEGEGDTERYGDPNLAAAETPGAITEGELGRLRTMLTDALGDPAALDAWLAHYLTRSRRPSYDDYYDDEEEATEPTDWQAALNAGATLRRRSVPELAFITQPDGNATVFVSGTAFADVSLAAAELLTGTTLLTADALAPHADTLRAAIDHGLSTGALALAA